MSVLEQLTVYADVRDPHLLQHITTAANSLVPGAVIRTADNDPLAFLNIWEKEREDVWQHVQNNVPLVKRLECFITDTLDTRSGAVTYAMHSRQMPVLSTVSVSIFSKSQNKNKDDALDELEDDWIIHALYATCASLGCSNSIEAVNVFFAFPATCGHLIALEGPSAALVAGQCRAVRDWIKCEIPNTCVVVVGAHGSNIVERKTDQCAKSEENEKSKPSEEEEEEEEEEEYGQFAALINDLLHDKSFSNIHAADPQLHGALCALHRFRHLPLLRYRLLRGAHVILCRPRSAVIKEIYRGCERRGLLGKEAETAVMGVMKSIMNFEHRWLEMPRPEITLVLYENKKERTNSLEKMWTEGLPDDWRDVVLKNPSNGVDDTVRAVLSPLLAST